MLEVNDGMVEVTINSSSQEPRTISVDVVILQLACEEVEAKHGLKPDAKGNLQATSEFLLDLARKLQAIGIEKCTGALALTLWQRASELVDQLKKNTAGSLSSHSGTESIPLA